MQTPQILTLAPTPLPTNQTLSSHLPTLTPTTALASNFNPPPNAFLTASYPTESKLQSTGKRGDVVAPGGTAKG